MRIVFLCGSLEPGRDGVGDYTKRLACELIRQGSEAAIVSLNDNFITEPLVVTEQIDEFVLQALRLSSTMSWKKRFEVAKEWIDKLSPNWLSLQYVPFSFNSKGLPFGFNRLVANLRKGTYLHVMFHELWVQGGYSFKMNIYASLQKMIIKQLKEELKPEVIHTHLPFFYLKLKKLNFDVKPLPLFSNVAVQKNERASHVDEVFRVGIFSHIDINQSIVNFLQNLKQIIHEDGILFEVLLIGENNQLKHFGNFLEGLDGFSNIVRYTGFLKSAAVSHAIQTCSIGLTSVKRHALGKSGTVAAFLSHQIPVAAPCSCSDINDSKMGFFSNRICKSIIINPDLSSINQAKIATETFGEEIEISRIAETFLKDLCNSY